MLSIVLPTYNEAKNLPELLKRIADVLKKSPYEVIVVDDDSPDTTWQVAEKLSKEYPVRVIRRIGRRGLSSAVVEGFDAAKGETLLVMDSDLQHDPSLIVQLADTVSKGADIAVASRYMKGGSVGEWVTGRRLLSKIATWLTRKIPPVEVSDPMSGFFALKTSVYQRVRPMLRPTGFKILFEVLGHLPRHTKTAEVPLVFKMRVHGESKLSLRVELQFLWQLVRIALLRTQKPLFWAVGIIMAAVLAMRVLPIVPLYTDAAVRSRAREIVHSIADTHGWLLSDIRIVSITPVEMTVIHRPHRRGADDPEQCYTVAYRESVPQFQPCRD